MIKVLVENKRRLCQGDVIKNVEFTENTSEEMGILRISKIVFPNVIVLTQDCDLAQDYTFRFSRTPTTNDDKLLVSALVAPLYTADHVFSGEHLSNIGKSMSPINRGGTPGKTILANNNPRYHFLEFPNSIGIADSIIDFKHYFSVNIEYLK